MSNLQDCLKMQLPPNLYEKIPKGYQRLGDILILNLPAIYHTYEERIAQCYAMNLPTIRIIANKDAGVKGWKREPTIRKIIGTGPLETEYKENSCRFRLNPFKILFSQGNKNERQHLPTLVNPGEIIIDMFACVGQFTIPIGVHALPEKIIAIEKNPIAYDFLIQNIQLNDLESKVTAVFGDAIEKTPKDIANRVIMGLIPKDPITFLPKAIDAIKLKGIIHFHASYHKTSIEKTFEEQLSKLALSYHKTIRKKNVRSIKKYSPNIVHVVFDLEIDKTK